VSQRIEDIAALRGASTFVEVLMWHALHRPDQRAFVYLERGEREAGSLTYAELDTRARTIAGALRSRGLVGRRAILAYPTSLEFVAALFGCLYAGVTAIPVPVASRGYAADRLRAILADGDAATVLSLGSVLREDAGQLAELVACSKPEALCLATDSLPTGDADAPVAPTLPGDLALLQYTSGSTGNPRGVMLTHTNLISNQRVLAATFGLSDGDRVVNWLPLYHDMGLIGGLLYPVFAGLTCYLMSPLAFLQRPMRWLEAIDRFRAIISMAPCFAYYLCAERSGGRAANLDLSSWRIAICGGETIRPGLLEDFAAAFAPAAFDPKAFLPAYGLAEATLMATALPRGTGLITHTAVAAAPGNQAGVSGEWTRRLACCGHPPGDHRLVIVDPLSSGPLPRGQTGEIWLQGPSISLGYWSRPEETRLTFRAQLAGETDSGEWLRTGDLGFLSADGLVVTGRAKEIIIIRGTNFDPLDLETAAGAAHPALVSGGGGAFSLDLNHGEGLVLVHEVKRGALKDVAADDVAAHVIEVISRYFGLTLYDFVLLRPGALPRTTSGKIQRHRCRQQYLSGELAVLQSVALPTLGRWRPRVHTVT
jgi:acyl-CoA synthetase (AMP-forming)/AMP-acid ligase II